MNNLVDLRRAMFQLDELAENDLSPDNWEAQLLPYVSSDTAFSCTARSEGVRFGGEYSFALNAKAAFFDEKDNDRVLLIESDHRLIECDSGDAAETIVRGRPVARHNGMVNALLRSGAVRSIAANEIMPDSAEKLRAFWMPDSESGVSNPIKIID